MSRSLRLNAASSRSRPSRADLLDREHRGGRATPSLAPVVWRLVLLVARHGEPPLCTKQEPHHTSPRRRRQPGRQSSTGLASVGRIHVAVGRSRLQATSRSAAASLGRPQPHLRLNLRLNSESDSHRHAHLRVGLPSDRGTETGGTEIGAPHTHIGGRQDDDARVPMAAARRKKRLETVRRRLQKRRLFVLIEKAMRREGQ